MRSVRALRGHKNAALFARRLRSLSVARAFATFASISRFASRSLVTFPECPRCSLTSLINHFERRRCDASAVTRIPTVIVAGLWMLTSGCLARFIGGDYRASQPYAFGAWINAARDEGNP